MLDFLSDCALMTASVEVGADSPADAVRLATLHGSKGLEFNTVFIVGEASDLSPLSGGAGPGSRWVRKVGDVYLLVLQSHEDATTQDLQCSSWTNFDISGSTMTIRRGSNLDHDANPS